VTPTACALEQTYEFGNICSGTDYGTLYGPGGAALATQFPNPFAVLPDDFIDFPWLLIGGAAAFEGSSLTDGIYTMV
jgi:hypothetical protein